MGKRSDDMETQIPSWLQHGIETYGYWIVMLAVALESMGVPFPGETTLLGAAIYAGATHRLSIPLVIAFAVAGAILGDNLGYTIGYRGGYPLLQRIGRALHINLQGLRYTERYFQKHGDKTVFVGRFFALLRTYVALFAGINRMPWRPFLIFNAAGGITWASIFGLLGFYLGNSPLLPTLLRILSTGGIVLLVVFVVGIMGYLVIQRRREKNILELAGSDDLKGTSSTSGPTQR